MLHALLLLACKSDSAVIVVPRELESFPYVDAGAVSPGERRSFIVPLFSQGKAPLRIFDIQIVAQSDGAVSDVFLVDDAWKTEDSNDDAEVDSTIIGAYDEESDEDTLALPVIFSPPAEGFFSAEMTVWSDDNKTTEFAPLPSDPTQEMGIWKVQLRGIAQYPCARVTPLFLDFGPRPAGGQYTESVEIENCGLVTIDVAQATFSDTAQGSVESGTLYPLYVLPGEAAAIDLRFTASSTGVSGDLAFVSNADMLDAQSVTLLGNTCDASLESGWDSDADGWSVCGGDCNDLDYSASPSAFERAGNGLDDDCDGEVDEPGNVTSTDDDGDGCDEIGQGATCTAYADCDDADPAIGPQAAESADGIDNDCNGRIDDNTERSDDDLDGHSEREGDCDDTNVLIDVDVVETSDGIDNNCNGLLDEGGPDYDDDGDGLTDNEGDCDDGDPWVYPDAFEFCDYYDNDCDGATDNGPDGEQNGACAFLPTRQEAGQ